MTEWFQFILGAIIIATILFIFTFSYTVYKNYFTKDYQKMSLWMALTDSGYLIPDLIQIFHSGLIRVYIILILIVSSIFIGRIIIK